MCDLYVSGRCDGVKCQGRCASGRCGSVKVRAGV